MERIDRNRLGSGTLGQQASLGLCWATAVIFPFETLTFFSSSSHLFIFIFFFCVWGLPVPESELGVYRNYPESRWPLTISSRAPAGGPSNLPPRSGTPISRCCAAEPLPQFGLPGNVSCRISMLACSREGGLYRVSNISTHLLTYYLPVVL